MGTQTAIAWTDHTFNPWIGCQEVSAACDHCYARDWAQPKTRFRGLWGRPSATPRHRTRTWNEPRVWERSAARAGERQRVFCASLADVFEVHPQLDDWRRELWTIIEQTPHLDWLLLTKRPEQLVRMLPSAWSTSPRDNVWLGTTVESPRWADIRIPRLLAAPAVVHFVSAEPLLEPLELERYLGPDRVNWVITGGESGPVHRPMDPDWSRSIREQCRAAGIAFFHKQGSHRYPGRDVELDGRLEHAWPRQ